MTFRSNWLVVPMVVLAIWGEAAVHGQVGAAAAGGLGLEQAIETALQNHPAMAAAESGRLLASANLSEARSGRLPALQFTETFTHGNNPVFVFGSLLEQGRFGPQNFAIDALNQPGSMSNFRSGLNLRLPVFNRFQVSGRIEQAEIGQEIAEARTEQARQQLRFAVVQAYFGVQVAEARRQVADEAVASTGAEVKRIRDLHEQGTIVASELLAMEVQLADFRQQQIQAAGDVLTAYAALNTVLGQPMSARPLLTERLADRAFELPGVDALMEQALESRADLREAMLEAQARKQDIRMARGQYLPDLNLFASVGQSSRNLTGGSGDFAIGASVTFNLVDFGRESRVRQSLAAEQVTAAQARLKTDEVRLEIIRAYQYFLAAQERVAVASGAAEQAEEASRIAGDRHGVGLTTVTEVLRSQTALVRARMNQLGARYDYYLGYAQTLLAAGALKELGAFAR
jgi:outer membrane protein